MMRAKRFKPQESDKLLLFTERDYDILYSLYKYQLFTTHQLEELHQGSKQKTKKRLRELFNAGYVRKFNTKVDLTKPGTEPDVYALTDKGARWLAHHRPDTARLNKRYNENNSRRTLATIPHALMVSDLMMRFELACYYNATRTAFIEQREMLDRAPELTRNRRSPTHWQSPVVVKGENINMGSNPDQVFGITDRERQQGVDTAYFFLEADRGSETEVPRTVKGLQKATIYKKLSCYYSTHVNKIHHGVFGDWMSNFRVLWVLDSYGRQGGGNTRLENFLELTNKITKAHMPDLFLFTTYEAFKNSNPLTHEWVNAKGEKRRIIE